MEKIQITLPDSELLGSTSRQSVIAYNNDSSIFMRDITNNPLLDLENINKNIRSQSRESMALRYYETDTYKNLNRRFDTELNCQKINNVAVEIFTPKKPIPTSNRERILINLHGGGFQTGARFASHVESIPICSMMGIKVVSIDYKQWPEGKFPSATLDVLAVYQALLNEYKSDNIGFFGCSAGALLTAQTMALLCKKGISLPKAIAMNSAGAFFWGTGDSGFIAQATSDYINASAQQKSGYLSETDSQDKAVFPGLCEQILQCFPSSLLISSSRDFALSSVLKTHTELMRLGVSSELHVWEGLKHAFTYNSELPEARDAYQIIVNFFEKHL